MFRQIVKGVFIATSHLFDVFPISLKWTIIRFLPGRLSHSFMNYGKPRIFEWKVGKAAKFRIRSDSEDDYFQLGYTNMISSYEPETLECWESVTKDTGLVLDVGAYTGIFTLIALRQGGANSCISFEPNPISCAKLITNIQLNSYTKKARVLNIGVGEEFSRRELKVPRLRNGSSAVQVSDSKVKRNMDDWITLREIEILTVDEVVAERSNRVSAIKIDVEGYEINVLKGAVNCLTVDKPAILLECLSLSDLTEIRSFLCDYGYLRVTSLDGLMMTREFPESIEDSTRARNYLFECMDTE